MAKFRQIPDQTVLLLVSQDISYSKALKKSRDKGYTSFIRKQTYLSLKRKYKTGRKQRFITRRGKTIGQTVRKRRIVRRERKVKLPKELKEGLYFGVQIFYECQKEVDYWPFNFWAKSSITYKFGNNLNEQDAYREFRGRVMIDFRENMSIECPLGYRITKVEFLRFFGAFSKK